MKRTAGLFLCLALLVGMLPAGRAQAAADPILITVNDKIVVFPDIQPFLDTSGRVQVPIRFLTEALKGSVTWDGATRKVTMARGCTTVEMTIGKKEYTIFGLKKKLDTTPMLRNGRTTVPLRFVAEAFGAEVSWDAATHTVHLTDTGEGSCTIGGFKIPLSEKDVPKGNAEGYLTIEKASGLTLSEGLFNDGHNPAMTVIIVTISVDKTGTNTAKQREEVRAMLKQRISEETVNQIMTHIASKKDEKGVIEQKNFKQDDIRVIATGYLGPIVLYLYLS